MMASLRRSATTGRATCSGTRWVRKSGSCLGGGGWDLRARNQFRNYLDEFGNVVDPADAHDIFVYSRRQS